ncbi:MAG: hypothetical protein R6U43_03920, partial [Candidatus Krumholzibacteriales bacterium]
MLLFPQFVTLIGELVLPPDGADQLLEDTQSSGDVEPCVTLTIFEGTPEAEIVTVQDRDEPVLLAVVVSVKLPGVVASGTDRVSQSQLSETLKVSTLLLPQLVTLNCELVPPPDGAAQLLELTQSSGDVGFCVTATVFEGTPDAEI